MKKLFIILGIVTTLSFTTKAQYEHRFSVTLSGNVASSFSTVESFSNGLFETDYYDPAAFANFTSTYGFNVGFHLNPGKRSALIFNIGYTTLSDWQYDYEASNEGLDVIDYNDALNANKFSLGAAPRLYLNPRSGVRVYMQLNVSINYLNLIYDYYGFTGYIEEKHLDNNFALGLEPAFGLDIRIGEKFGIFFQNGVEFNMYNESNFPTSFFDTSINKSTGSIYEDRPTYLQKDNLNLFKIELGLRYSFLKSKKI